MLSLLRVSGDSLAPAYQDGDFVVVSKIPFFLGMIRCGDIIVFKNSEYGTMIKKVDRITPGGDEIYVVGTHENSVDSRRFGAISKQAVVGKVIWHIKGRS
jgi:signal peptidase I